MRRTLVAVVVALFVFASCDLLPGPDATQPEDIVQDVLRTGEFDYDVYLPVELSLAVHAPRTTADEQIVVRLVGSDDATYFQGALSPGEVLETEVMVPGSLDSATLMLDSANYETRTVTIEEPAQYLTVDRTLGVTPKETPDPLADSDADGIPDVYDAFPNDPDLAFTQAFPANGELTIAFEDNFPELGDADFNDFVASYRIQEHRSPKNKLVEVTGSATALARGAGFTHLFGVLLEQIGVPIEGSVTYHDSTGTVIETVDLTLTVPLQVPLFRNTKEAFDRAGGLTMDNVNSLAQPTFGHTTTFSVTYAKGSTTSTTGLWQPYNPYLLVTDGDTPYTPDIHLIGQNPLPGSANPAGYEDFRDPDSGAPWALLVPGNWQWPREFTPITTAYPDFASWRDSGGTTDSDWYLYPVADKVYTP